MTEGDRMIPRRVFLSHTDELRRYPVARSFVAAAEAALSRMGEAIVDMAYFAAIPDPPDEVCRRAVRSCDVFISIVGFRYGSVVPTRPESSYSELEFDTAGEAGIPRLVFLLDERVEGPAALFVDPEHGARQRAFRARLAGAGVTAATVASPDQLETAILQAMSRLRRASAGTELDGRVQRARLSAHFEPRARGVEPFGTLLGWYFCGRVRALTELVGWLVDRPPEDPRTRLVVGAPGSGKSAILGRLAVMSDRGTRSRVPQQELDDAPAGTVCPAGAVAGQVHVRGLTVDEVALAIADQAGIDATDCASLLVGLSEVGPTPVRVVLVDAVDESVDPEALVRSLLAPLARMAGHSGLRMVIGSRPGAGRRLVRAFGRSAVEVDLDSPRYCERADLVAYAERLLTAAGENDNAATTPYRARAEVTRTVAEAVADRADRSFLVAHFSAIALSEDPSIVDVGRPGWRAALPRSVDEAMDRYLARFGDHRNRVRDLLTPLAFAEGDGIDDIEVWAALATALGTARYEPTDVAWLLTDTGASDLLTRVRLDEDVVCHRLFHEALAEHLREPLLASRGSAAVARSFASALVNTVPARLDGSGPDWARAGRYRLRYLSVHAAAGGAIDALLTDPAFLAVAEPSRLLPASRQAKSVEAAQVAAALERVGRQFLFFPEAQRLSYLELAARKCAHDGLGNRIAAAAPDRPWSVPWARWVATDAGRTVGHHGRYIHAVATLELHGTAVIATCDRTSIRLWDVAAGHELEVLAAPGSASIAAMVATSSDLGPRIVTRHVDGNLGFWNPETGGCTFRRAARPGLGGESAGVFAVDRDVVLVETAAGLVTVWRASDARSIGHYPLPTGSRPMAAARLDGVDHAVLLCEGDRRRARIWDLAADRAVGEPFVLDDEVELWSAVLGLLEGRPAAFLGNAGGPHSGRSESACIHEMCDQGWTSVPEAGWGPLSAVLARQAESFELRVGGADGTLRRLRWDGRTFRRTTTVIAHEAGIEAVAVTGRGQEIVDMTAGRDGAIRAWSPSVGSTAEPDLAPMWPGSHVVLRLGSRSVLLGVENDGTIRRWDAGSGAPLEPLRLRHEAASSGGRVMGVVEVGAAGEVLTAVAFSNGSVLVFRPGTGEVVTAVAIGSPLEHLRVAPAAHGGGPMLVCCAADGVISTYDLDRSAWVVRRRRIHPDEGPIDLDVLVLDGRRLAAATGSVRAGESSVLQVWDLDDDAAVVRSPSFEGSRRWSIAAGEVDDMAVAVAVGDGSAVGVWELRSGEPVRRGTVDDGHHMAMHRTSIERLGGRDVIVTGGHAGALSLWNLDGSIRSTIEFGYTVSHWCAVGDDTMIVGGARGFARLCVTPSMLSAFDVIPST
jgi:WD40 repeat protein